MQCVICGCELSTGDDKYECFICKQKREQQQAISRIEKELK